LFPLRSVGGAKVDQGAVGSRVSIGVGAFTNGKILTIGSPIQATRGDFADITYLMTVERGDNELPAVLFW